MNTKNNIRICLDLELEQPNTNKQTPDSLLDKEKIIQIGYVIFDCLTGEFLAHKLIHINIGVPISEFIRNLTRIKNEDIQNGTDLVSAFKELVSDFRKFKADRVILDWGGGDARVLRDELIELGLKPEDWPFSKYNHSGQNVKHLYRAYCDAFGLDYSGGLSKSMAKVGLLWDNLPKNIVKVHGKHNALIDAYNTARMYLHLIKKFKK